MGYGQTRLESDYGRVREESDEDKWGTSGV
jgi:hypothetical protein